MGSVHGQHCSGVALQASCRLPLGRHQKSKTALQGFGLQTSQPPIPSGPHELQSFGHIAYLITIPVRFVDHKAFEGTFNPEGLGPVRLWAYIASLVTYRLLNPWGPGFIYLLLPRAAPPRPRPATCVQAPPQLIYCAGLVAFAALTWLFWHRQEM